MKKFSGLIKFTYFFTCWWIILSINAHAYIDPSAVTYIIQAVAAVFIALGALVAIKYLPFSKKIQKKMLREKFT